MQTQTLFALLGGIISLVIIIAWAITLKRTFAPGQGEIYVVTFFGIHILEVRVGDPKAKFYQKFAFYILFWPFNRAKFMYKWVQEMTYSDYLRKLRISETKSNYNVSIDWEPEYDEGGNNADGTVRLSELEADGTPKDKSVKILVVREEMMNSLRRIEGYTIAVEFETSDGFRGWRLFTLFLNIESLSKFISEIRQGQLPAQKMFSGEYNAWSKKVTYVQLRQTTINTLNIELGKDKNIPFIQEINDKVKGFGYTVRSIAEGAIYFNLATRDMLESQELPKKAADRKNVATIEADTTKITADAEALRIATVEGASNKILQQRIQMAVEAYGKLTENQVKQLEAKYGKDGIGKLQGVYVEANSGDNGGSNSIEVKELVQDILGFKIATKQIGGTV